MSLHLNLKLDLFGVLTAFVDAIESFRTSISESRAYEGLSFSFTGGGYDGLDFKNTNRWYIIAPNPQVDVSSDIARFNSCHSNTEKSQPSER